MKNKRFLIASGGTGGHFYPGFALGKALQAQGAEVCFVVRKNDPAAQVLAREGLACQQLDLHTGLPRSFSPLRHGRFIKQLFRSFQQTRALIQTFRPDVVLGMGGYVSFPLIFCAHRLGVKTAIHESNALWGLSNKICGRFATVRLLGLPMRTTYSNAVLVSTPVRADFAQPVNPAQERQKLGLAPTRPTALIMGGSQGAKGLNEALPHVIKNAPNWQFIHLTGTRWYDAQQRAYEGLPNVKALPYSEEVYKLMKACDVVICRSGASTLAELIACRLPAILVPYPHAAANHQYFNAKVLADTGCAQIVQEGPQLSERLTQALLACTPQTLAARCKAYGQLPIPNPLGAANKTAQLLLEL